ncbi:M20/M25/M40 family metallo-hydrolase [Rhodohalobacter sp. SW132]|uniref:M20/M25/M40 family metallo-hydrolase n=1 Tax=Rhodohalobacter sp. SW132 TaxID=2293433 RepID=UPI000E23EB78|nr:M20/M25/M40 family metallo-hydrolase [Rhodohalobacter sp. SW132]REL29089.1 M20/M25/M40 family metallo-hydrolase [Rhodohalobacter sp. SW132]
MSLKSVIGSLDNLQDQLAQFREILLANLVMIGEIPSPTTGEEDRIEFLLNRFNEAGLPESSIDECGNGIGVLNGTEGEKSILINAHADTVFSSKTDHTMQVTSDSITGPGVADNSLGLAVLATLPYILEELDIKLKNNLILFGGTKSLGRGDLEGIRFFLDNNDFNIKNALCIEGVELGRLSYTSIGMLRGEITCKVPETYDWSRFGDASAILTLNEVINKLNDMRLPKRPRTSVVMGSISGGSSFNTIAKEATLGFELRSESEEVVEDVGKTIQDIAMEVASKTGDEVELDIFARRRPGGIPYAHPLNECARSVMKNLEIEPRLAPSTSELAALIDKGIPALTLGITSGDRIHKMNESVKIEPIYKGLAQLIGILIATDGGFCE